MAKPRLKRHLPGSVRYLLVLILVIVLTEAVVRRCSIRKLALRNFTKFTRKHLCQSLFFNKVAGLRLATLLKERLWHRYFPINFVEFLRTRFLTEHLRTSASKMMTKTKMTNWNHVFKLFSGGLHG